MQLLPEDLGQWRLIALAHLRMTMYGPGGRIARRHIAPAYQMNLLTVASPQGGSGDAHKLGFWGRLYTNGLGLSPDVANAVFDAIKPAVGGIVGGTVGGLGGGFGVNGVMMLASGQPTVQIIGSIFATVGAIGVAGGLLAPRFMLKKIVKAPLSVAEISYLIECAGDNQLMKDYLTLAQEAMQRTNLTLEGEKNLREAIRALGELIDRVPDSLLAAQDANKLRVDIADVEAEISREIDPIVLASLQRRLTAQESSLKSVERANVISRRSRALREEISAQIESVRLGMASLQDGSQETGANFGQIADSVRRVAAEAGSLADARTELTAYITRPTTVEEPAVLRIRQ